MQCYVVKGPSLDQIELDSREEPRLVTPRDVKVKVKACSLNYRDLMVARGEYSSKKHGFTPTIPLSDFAGEVEEVGSGVEEFKPGDRVVNAPFRAWPAGKLQAKWAKSFVGAMGVDGVLAEKVVYPADSLFKIPSSLSYLEASTLPVAGLTAWAALVSFGKIRPGEWVLLEGTGGVSVFAAQIAKALGAKIIMTTSNPEKGSELQDRLKVDAIVNYKDVAWPKRIKEITEGQGVDLVVEVVGGDNLGEALSVCNYGARVALIGVLGGGSAHFKIPDLLFHQVTLQGIVVESAEEMSSFLKAVPMLNLKPYIDKVFPFEEAVAAYRSMEAQFHKGKLVISIS